MFKEPYNVLEQICRHHLPQILATRKNLCNCAQCQEDILAYALSRLPPIYVTSDKGAMFVMSDYAAVEKSAVVLTALLHASEVVGKNPVHQTAVVRAADSDEAYQLLLKQIKQQRGLDFSRYREDMVKRRIEKRMRLVRVASFADYLQVLLMQPQEYEALFTALTINVTAFFRDAEVWEALRKKILPELLARRKTDRRALRLWSAGCASGAEAYSLAILCQELVSSIPGGVAVEIIASDIDPVVLKQARLGRYNRELLKNVDAQRLRRFFQPQGDEFVVVPQLKSVVRFEERNLIDSVLSGIDLVLCRNVFIYFNRSLQEHLIMQFYRSLNPEGYFVMGLSEMMLGEARQVFSAVDLDTKLYRKITPASGADGSSSSNR